MRLRIRSIWALLAMVSMSGSTFAQGTAPAAAPQAAPPGQYVVLPVFRTEIVVTAERGQDQRQRLPVAMSTLSRNQIALLPGVTLAETIGSLPGYQMLFASDVAGAPRLIARGFFGGDDAGYVKLLVDGVPLQSVESGGADWQRLRSFAIDRIESVRGPASAVYGDGALGGVIQIFTRSARERSWQISANRGTFGSVALDLAMTHKLPGVTLDAIASTAGADGYRSHGSLQEKFGSVSLRGLGVRHRWTVRGSTNASARDYPGPRTADELSADRFGSAAAFRFDREVVRKSYGAASFASDGAGFHYSVLGYVRRRDGDDIRTSLFAANLWNHAAREVATISAGATLETDRSTSYAGIAGDLRMGAEISRDRRSTSYQQITEAGDVAGALGDFRGRRLRAAVYASQALSLGSRVRASMGLRWDRIHDGAVVGHPHPVSNAAWSPRAGASILIGPEQDPTTLFVHISRAFKAATFDQLFDPLVRSFGSSGPAISNPHLHPEGVTSADVGFRQAARDYRWEVLAYRMKVEDEIRFDPATFTYGNIGRSTHAGVEIDGEALPGGVISPTFTYAWTWATREDGRQLGNVPRFLMRTGFNARLAGSINAHARLTRTRGAYLDDANRFALGDRVTLDVRVAKRFGRAMVVLDLLNASGARYEEMGFVLPDATGAAVPFYFPAPGFSARTGFELRF